MTKLEKLLGLLLTSVLVAVFCLIVMLRRSRESVEAAGRESAELRVQNEDLESKLAALRGDFGRQQAVQSMVGLIAGQPQATDLTELNRRVDQLAAQQLNILAFLPNLVISNSLIETPEQKQQGFQRAIAVLSEKKANKEAKSDSARLKLEQMITSLNVPDEVAAVDDVTGLNTPSLRTYWPFFKARQEWRDTEDMIRFLNRKLEVSEIDMETESAQTSENSK
jgi:hypothetical protein